MIPPKIWGLQKGQKETQFKFYKNDNQDISVLFYDEQTQTWEKRKNTLLQINDTIDGITYDKNHFPFFPPATGNALFADFILLEQCSNDVIFKVFRYHIDSDSASHLCSFRKNDPNFNLTNQDIFFTYLSSDFDVFHKAIFVFANQKTRSLKFISYGKPPDENQNRFFLSLETAENFYSWDFENHFVRCPPEQSLFPGIYPLFLYEKPGTGYEFYTLETCGENLRMVLLHRLSHGEIIQDDSGDKFEFLCPRIKSTFRDAPQSLPLGIFHTSSQQASFLFLDKKQNKFIGISFAGHPESDEWRTKIELISHANAVDTSKVRSFKIVAPQNQNHSDLLLIFQETQILAFGVSTHYEQNDSKYTEQIPLDFHFIPLRWEDMKDREIFEEYFLFDDDKQNKIFIHQDRSYSVECLQADSSDPEYCSRLIVTQENHHPIVCDISMKIENNILYGTLSKDALTPENCPTQLTGMNPTFFYNQIPEFAYVSLYLFFLGESMGTLIGCYDDSGTAGKVILPFQFALCLLGIIPALLISLVHYLHENLGIFHWFQDQINERKQRRKTLLKQSGNCTTEQFQELIQSYRIFEVSFSNSAGLGSSGISPRKRFSIASGTSNPHSDQENNPESSDSSLDPFGFTSDISKFVPPSARRESIVLFDKLPENGVLNVENSLAVWNITLSQYLLIAEQERFEENVKKYFSRWIDCCNELQKMTHSPRRNDKMPYPLAQRFISSLESFLENQEAIIEELKLGETEIKNYPRFFQIGIEMLKAF